MVRRYDEGRKHRSGGWWGGHVLKVAYINLIANLIMMKMLSRTLQNNGDEFCGGLWEDGAGGGHGRRACELLSKITGLSIFVF